ncbi:Uncharacterized protein Adt_46409 [Abeliophyllum distichum]|uniref:Uncharacterized protein n=1 Tax=Abeliophyllum distichum TaxID=126358 RepID=A0ABD1P0B6_9LAMI
MEKENPKPCVCRAEGLMYIDVKINGKSMKAMVYNCATHNYLADLEVKYLELVLEERSGKVKAINSVAQPISGVAKSVLIKVGPFKGRTNLFAVHMDDFKQILGLDFLRDMKSAEFEDVKPEELSRRLLPMRAIDHKIELIPGAKPPARAPYHMAQPELEELRKQLAEMLDSRIIVPVKSPYGALVLFQKRADGSL